MKSEHHHQILRIGNILGTPNFSLNWIRLIQKDQINPKTVFQISA